MKSLSQLKKNNRGVFGLTSVQAFFAIILGIALLAYVIVVIFGTLNESTVLSGLTLSASVTNETVSPTDVGTALSVYTLPNCQATITKVLNDSTGVTISAGNYTVINGCYLKNLSSTYSYTAWNVSYTYTYDSNAQVNSKNILTNTSGGITSFFGSVNPVYAILAILVIILVLIVLVRVVTGGEYSGRTSANPQL